MALTRYIVIFLDCLQDQWSMHTSSPLIPTAYTELLYTHLRAANSDLMANSYRRCYTACVVVCCCHGTQECLLQLYRGTSPKQAHGILHYCSITRKCDPPIAHEAKLLLGYPQELCKYQCAEVCQWNLEPPLVGSVHHAVALAGHGGAAVIIFLCHPPGDPLSPQRCHLLPLLGQLSNPLGVDHGWLFLSWLETGELWIEFAMLLFVKLQVMVFGGHLTLNI